MMRKHDHLSRQKSRSKNGGKSSMLNQHIEKLLAYETELDDLELQLDALLDAESKRREKGSFAIMRENIVVASWWS